MEILIKKAIKGDSEAFISLINRHELALYKTAKAILNNEDDIGDAIQETILAAYKSIDKLKNSKYFNSSEGNLKGIKELNLQTNEIANLTGNWNLNIKLDEAMVNSEVVNYVVDKENDIVEVIEARGMATGLKVKFRINTPVDETIISQVKLLDKKGTEYRSDRIASMGIVDGKDIVEMTFEASKFENLDKFDLVVEDLNGKDEVVKLIKKEK